MHYPNLTFHGVEVMRLGFNTPHRRIYGWQPGSKIQRSRHLGRAPSRLLLVYETILATRSRRPPNRFSGYVPKSFNPNLAPRFFPYVFLTNLLARPYARPAGMKLEFSACG